MNLRWFLRPKSSDRRAAKRDRKQAEQRHAQSKARRSAKRYRRQPAPLTWNDPDQDFITRYGDPFDG